MSEEQKVYVLTAIDPYDKHDCPSIVSIFTSREAADAARIAKYEYTFGVGSSSEKWRYYEIAEMELLTEWTPPEWMQRTRHE